MFKKNSILPPNILKISLGNLLVTQTLGLANGVIISLNSLRYMLYRGNLTREADEAKCTAVLDKDNHKRG